MKNLKLLGVLLVSFMIMGLNVFAENDATIAEMREALSNGKSYELKEDITLKEEIFNLPEKYPTRKAGFAIYGSGEVVIEGNNHTIDSSLIKILFEVFAEEGKKLTVTVKNLNIVSSKDYARGFNTRTGNLSLNLENVTIDFSNTFKAQPVTIGDSYPVEEVNNVNITNSKLIAGFDCGYAYTTFNKVNTTIKNSELSGWTALNVKGEYFAGTVIDEDGKVVGYDPLYNDAVGSNGSTFNISGTKLIGKGYKTSSGESNDYAVIKLEANNITLNIDSSEITASKQNTNKEYLITQDHVITFKNDEIVNVEGKSIVNITNTKLTTDTEEEGFEPGEIAVINIGEGVTSNQNLKNVNIKDGYVLTKVENGYTVLKEATSEIKELDTKEEVKEVTVGVADAKTTGDVLLKSLEANKELAEKVEGTPVKVEVEIAPVKPETIKETVKTSMAEKAGKAKIATYFDITVAIKNAVTKAHIDNIPELTSEIELVVLLPEDLRNTDTKVNRTYYVIREHDGKVEKLPATLSEDGKSLTFKSDKFSTYALAYEDVAKVDVKVPQTADGITTSIIAGTLAIVSAAGICLYLKKRNA